MTRTTIRRTARLFLGIGSLAGALALFAPIAGAQPVPIPIGSKARKEEPLPAGEKIELSLSRAIALSLQNVLDLDVASLQYEKAGFSIGAAGGVFDPYLQLEVNASRTQSPVFSRIQASDSKRQNLNAYFGGFLPFGTTYQAGWTNSRSDSVIPGFTIVNPTYSSNLFASVTQPLLRNFGTKVNTRLVVQARIARDTSAWEFVKSVQTTVQNVENAYWDLVFALENLTAKVEGLDRARDLNRITKIKIDVGALAPIDIVQTEVTIAQREQDIITAEGLIGDAQDRLKRLLNVSSLADWTRPIAPTDRPSDAPITVDLDAGMRQALETRPEVKQAVVDIESKKVSFAYNRNQLLPKLDFNGQYGYAGLGAKTSLTADNGSVQNIDYVDALYQIRGREFPSWTAGLVFNLPIGNHTARANFASASADLDLSRTSLAILKQNLTVEVRGAARAVDTSFRTIAAAKKSRELAERNVDAERKKFENGMSTSFTVSQIQNDLTNARSVELQAISGYRKSIAAWHKAIGD
ncbi:MAG TPA: TolC family protein, partial [Thermoanaerobaculia bacterium]|nr:TolC family protein [Thermoanaerobaculia bacterium]